MPAPNAGKGKEANPLGHVLQAIGEPLECVYYDTWNVVVPEGTFLTRVRGSGWGAWCCGCWGLLLCSLLLSKAHPHAQVGNDNFGEVLAKIRGQDAVAEWQRLQARVCVWWAQTVLPHCSVPRAVAAAGLCSMGTLPPKGVHARAHAGCTRTPPARTRRRPCGPWRPPPP